MMTWLQSIVLGLVQGFTEFLPISSSAHMRIVSSVFFGADAGASFTAVTQLGTELAVVIYFAKDIVVVAKTWLLGLFDDAFRDNLNYRIGWFVIYATIPLGLLGYLLRGVVRSGARNLWLVASVLIVFSLVIWYAERFSSRRYGRGQRPLEQLTARDALTMGAAQCLALIPGVSRSGATSSAGLFTGLERAAAVRFSFLLAIPAVLASGIFSLPDAFHPSGEGLQATAAQLVVATVIAFVVGFASVAWLLRFVARHSLNWFVGYRIVLGVAVLALLMTGTVSAV